MRCKGVPGAGCGRTSRESRSEKRRPDWLQDVRGGRRQCKGVPGAGFGRKSRENRGETLRPRLPSGRAWRAAASYAGHRGPDSAENARKNRADRNRPDCRTCGAGTGDRRRSRDLRRSPGPLDRAENHDLRRSRDLRRSQEVPRSKDVPRTIQNRAENLRPGCQTNGWGQRSKP